MQFSLLLPSLIQSDCPVGKRVSSHFPSCPFLPFHQEEQMFVLQVTGLHRLFSLSDSQMPLKLCDFLLNRTKMSDDILSKILDGNSKMSKMLEGKYMFWGKGFLHSLAPQSDLKPIYCAYRKRLPVLDNLSVWHSTFCYHSQGPILQVVFPISFTECSQVTEVCRHAQHLAG